ncbi:hypothetical protein R84B8_00523 [Treponema sp. R8-4-B8]
MKKNFIIPVLFLMLIFSAMGVYGQSDEDANESGLTLLGKIIITE